MIRKYKTFLTIAKMLNEELNITPVLYGSLGLSMCIKEKIEINDIDILVPEDLLKDKWPLLEKAMNNLKYDLINLDEHEFKKNGQVVAFGRLGGIDDDLGIDSSKLEIADENGVRFFVLSLNDYKKAYAYSLKDGYRRKKRGTADKLKIETINKHLF